MHCTWPKPHATNCVRWCNRRNQRRVRISASQSALFYRFRGGFTQWKEPRALTSDAGMQTPDVPRLSPTSHCILIFAIFLPPVFFCGVIITDYLEDASVCLLSKKTVKMNSRISALLIKLSKYPHVSDFAIDCHLEIKAPTNMGLQVIIEDMNLRRNPLDNECDDYVWVSSCWTTPFAAASFFAQPFSSFFFASLSTTYLPICLYPSDGDFLLAQTVWQGWWWLPEQQAVRPEEAGSH